MEAAMEPGPNLKHHHMCTCPTYFGMRWRVFPSKGSKYLRIHRWIEGVFRRRLTRCDQAWPRKSPDSNLKSPPFHLSKTGEVPFHGNRAMLCAMTAMINDNVSCRVFEMEKITNTSTRGAWKSNPFVTRLSFELPSTVTTSSATPPHDQAKVC